MFLCLLCLANFPTGAVEDTTGEKISEAFAKNDLMAIDEGIDTNITTITSNATATNITTQGNGKQLLYIYEHTEHFNTHKFILITKYSGIHTCILASTLAIPLKHIRISIDARGCMHACSVHTEWLLFQWCTHNLVSYNMSDTHTHAFTTGTSNGDGQAVLIINKNISLNSISNITTNDTLLMINNEHAIESNTTSINIIDKIDANDSLQASGNEAHGKLS
jgi:hypothetical protein